ncbi:NADH:flavin oxidoreductase/NADH oxidase family protein [Aspergillus saccharolyticus JOP 1030-1]|uniref:NADH oxidase n=1 Tax=Aspergillus saccharolyticus JOP 1030-1 TaxID=1450539 RepID=A0A318ZMF6_9EURO|nr:NADH oxidase [Aspergillus saccharolyticus JOP 1030-1]PYH41368.1 NADH oxidase [Aspergillus saccharolyticus JOP 1030-1]
MTRAGLPVVDATPLAQPLQFSFSQRSAPNRFLKGAMSERLSSWSATELDARGIPSDELIEAYRVWGAGQIGLLLTGNVMIDPAHLEAAGNLILPASAAPEAGDERFQRFQQLAAAAKTHGSLIVAQVSHPGRQTSELLQPHPISASDVQLVGQVLGSTFAKPRAATEADLQQVVEGFAHAAAYLERAGFDGIQLHAAHGYLLSQFLSETTNRRTDRYGGSLENRMRLILEIREAIAQRVRPDFVVGIKVNSVEFQPNGFQPDEARQLCQALEAHRFDFVELSGGTYENWKMGDEEEEKRDSTKKREAFFMEFAQNIVSSLSTTKSYLTGGFRSAQAMVKALDTLDGVGLGRPLCQEPFLCRDILSGKATGALELVIPAYDFGLTAVAACIQIRQLGRGLAPIDLTDKKNAEQLVQAVVQRSQLKGKDVSQEAVWPPLIPGYNIPLAVEA